MVENLKFTYLAMARYYNFIRLYRLWFVGYVKGSLEALDLGSDVRLLPVRPL